MSLVTSEAGGIVVPNGNGLAVYLDKNGVLQLRDVRGTVQSLQSLLNIPTPSGGSSPFTLVNATKSIQTTCGTNQSLGDYSSVLGGNSNGVTSPYSAVVSGRQNTVCGGYNDSAILGGYCNSIFFSNASSILSGYCNNVYFSQRAAIISGSNNRLTSSNQSVIASGCNNQLQSSQRSFIGSGSGLRGQNNSIFFGTGYCNRILSPYSTVINGSYNINCGTTSLIVSGYCNNINNISGLNALKHGVIISGVSNIVRGSHATVLNGVNNVACGYHSFASGYGSCALASYAGAFGSYVTNNVPNSWMANQLRAVNLQGGASLICVDAYGTIIRSVSDSRCKSNIKPLAKGLSEVVNLNPVTFNWNKEASKTMGKQNEIGFIAQEVQKVVPEAVVVGKNDIYGLNSDKLLPIAIKAIQELNMHICGICSWIETSNAKT